MRRAEKTEVCFNGEKISIENIVDIALFKAKPKLADDNAFRSKIQKSVDFLERLLAEKKIIYGITTGYGDSCTTNIPNHLINKLPEKLYTFHGCGLGDMFSQEQTRAILATRLNSLVQGFSGVRFELLEQLILLIDRNILPVIPQEGSVGASGDLTPLSYIAAVLCGERDVLYKGVHQSARNVFNELNISPISLKPKEGLAVMNGTAVMTALACLAFKRAEYLSQLCSRITALCSIALKGNSHHFDELLFSVKPHPGQSQIAAWIRKDLKVFDAIKNSSRLQDRYSLRCAPHVIGVLQDALPFFHQLIENELNSANDNPIIDGVSEHILHGGHFYGGHIAFAMDSMKNAVANLADLLDRQIAQLVDVKFNHGLPANLSGAPNETVIINHGFKAVQIGCSAWTAEALKLTLPASIFSRSTECHNQDKVSMGAIAARDALRVLQLTEQVAASVLIAACQGVNLRLIKGEIHRSTLSENICCTLDEVGNVFDFLEEDRALDSTLREVVSLTQAQHWTLY
jgi:histidine ammonia-lyase